ncbi:fluoride efflux transporter CrcB [Gordonia hankookensis]|uniref:Fluoride-specific ion channel FluC n=1 Tax=Gordonia hankookensis TaxID=589403 RepID=A0ABR7W7H8_9ACTN|nr:fluoride efflux transporter CrcB [Gordonia hankookensis]MBD1318555.1 fluoride efflux transporter CrcB [Gordonia hankookensis]
MTVVAVMLAGALGAVARFVVDGAIKQWRPTTFPWATFIINVSGSLLLGFLAGLVMFHSAPTGWQTVLGTGFCGGYTTFSTASFETVRLAEKRRTMSAAVYALGSVLVSSLVCGLGLVLAWAL